MAKSLQLMTITRREMQCALYDRPEAGDITVYT
jgi:hypothetical protein